MKKYCTALTIATLFSTAFGSGKEEAPPKLSPSVFQKLQKAKIVKETPAEPETLYTCLPGFILHENMCAQIIREKPRSVCTGTSQADGSCQLQVPSVPQCVGGYTPELGNCARIVETGFQFYCPKGYYDDGAFCAKSVEGEIRTQCPVGVLEGNRCVLRERKPHIIKSKCPEGTKLDDGICWKEIETFDCTTPAENTVSIIAAQQEQMQLGKKVLVSKGKTHGLRSLIGKEPVHLPSPPPPQPPLIMTPGKEMVAVQAPHPERVEVVSQVCSKKIQVDALALIQCPPDYVDSGDICVKEIITQPLNICVAGQEKDGTCQPVIKRIPKHPGCPKDSWLARGKCWKKDIISSIPACPKGFTLSGKVCLGSIPATLECPIGFELLGDTCIGKVVRPPISLKIDPQVASVASKKY